MGEMLVVVGARFKRGSEVREMVEEIRKREREREIMFTVLILLS